jgi:hypothetical protein
MFMLAAFVVLALSGARSAPALTPSGAWVGLDNGRVGDYLWEVKAMRRQGSSGNAGAQRPCLMVGTTWELSPFNYRRSRFRACTGPAGRLVAGEAPLIATGVQPSSGSKVDMTAVGMIFAPAVRRVQVTLSDGRLQTIDLRKLSAGQARNAKLNRFEYTAFAFRGLWCAERMVSESATGKTLWDSGTDNFACGSDGSDSTSFE